MSTNFDIKISKGYVNRKFVWFSAENQTLYKYTHPLHIQQGVFFLFHIDNSVPSENLGTLVYPSALGATQSVADINGVPVLVIAKILGVCGGFNSAPHTHKVRH